MHAQHEIQKHKSHNKNIFKGLESTCCNIKDYLKIPDLNSWQEITQVRSQSKTQVTEVISRHKT